eukprot:SAG22_NODE_1566_length_4109_cov_1.659102_3_plen_145_part_00
MPSLLGPFGVRDCISAAAQTDPVFAGLASASELRVRSWVENADCCHVVLVNCNTSVPGHTTIVLTGAVSGLQGGEARRLFDAVYTVPTRTYYMGDNADADGSGSTGAVVMFTDWVAAGHTNVYRLGTNCSDTAVWRAAIAAGTK